MRDASTCEPPSTSTKTFFRRLKNSRDPRGVTAGRVVSDLARKALTSTGRALKIATVFRCCRGGRRAHRDDEAGQRAAETRSEPRCAARCQPAGGALRSGSCSPRSGHDWFADHHANGWATCPLTENGFVRILANPRYTARARPPADIINHLRPVLPHTSIMCSGPTRSR